MLEQAEHLKRIVLVTIGQWICPVVRIQLAIGDGDTR